MFWYHPASKLRFDPTTLRLTAERLIAASRCKHKAYAHKKRIIALIGGTLGHPTALLSGHSPKRGFTCLLTFSTAKKMPRQPSNQTAAEIPADRVKAAYTQ